MTRSRLLVLALFAAAVVAWFAFGLNRYLDFSFLKQQHTAFQHFYHEHPTGTIAIFFTVYVAVAAMPLPVAGIMTIAAGALFGLWVGTIIVSFASSISATLAFLAARFVFRDIVRQRFGQRAKWFDAGIQREGAFYLLSIRLVTVIPFFMVNLLMGLTAMRAWTFYWVSQVGMLAVTVIYVNAGTQIVHLQKGSDIVSPNLLGTLFLIALFPLLARLAVARLRLWRLHRRWPRPKQFDRNLVVIGGGSAGLISAYVAATTCAAVTLVERDRMGGDCLNTGCVPSKALLRVASLRHTSGTLERFGLDGTAPRVNFDKIMARVHDVVERIAPHDSVERYRELGVDCRRGTARLLSPWEVEIRNGSDVERVTTRAIIIATGASPAIPPIPGIDAIRYVTSESLWSLEELPEKLLVLGGGPVGCELAQAFARLGSAVTLVEMLPRLINGDDEQAATLVAESLASDRVDLRLATEAIEFAIEDGVQVLHASGPAGASRIEFDIVLIATGRRPDTEALGLDTLAIDTRHDGTVLTNDYLQTGIPNIYACGDVAGPYQFTHTAAHQAWYAAVNALFGRFWRFHVDYSAIPWATFTDPEVAQAGLTEAAARDDDIDFEVTRYDLTELDRAIVDGNTRGFVKVLTRRGSDRIIGVTIVGYRAAELIAEYVLAMKHGIGLNKVLATTHIYPTLAEANRLAAGQWRRKYTPGRLLDWAERFQRWQRR